MLHPPHNHMANEARHHAVAELKKVVRAAFAKRTENSGPRGPVILAAVEGLPYDLVKFNALPDEERLKLEDFIVKTEIGYSANGAIKLIEEKFPHLKAP